MTRSKAVRIGLPALVVLLALATPRVGSTAASVAGCPRGVPAHPVGSVLRVYAIPRGCVWLTIPQPEASIPVLHVRQRDARGRWYSRSFLQPRDPLPPGADGVCPQETGVFVVAYPFLTVAAGAGQNLGDPPKMSCNADLARMVIWIGELTAAPKLTVTWRTG